MLTPPTVTDLAAFAGRPAAGFTAFADTALAQATLLFELHTGRGEWPDDPTEHALATNGVCELADLLFLQNAYREQKGKPYSSETIANWSYSVAKAKAGEEAGLRFWDLAVATLTADDQGPVVTGGIIGFDAGIATSPAGVRYLPGAATAVARYDESDG